MGALSGNGEDPSWTSATVQKLTAARETASAAEWLALLPAFDHAIAIAREAEHRAAVAADEVQAHVDPKYPPLVLLLAAGGVAGAGGAVGFEGVGPRSPVALPLRPREERLVLNPPAEEFVMRARKALDERVVVRPSLAIAAQALQLRADGVSRRGVAALLGIDRTVVVRLERFADEQAAATESPADLENSH